MTRAIRADFRCLAATGNTSHTPSSGSRVHRGTRGAPPRTVDSACAGDPVALPPPNVSLILDRRRVKMPGRLALVRVGDLEGKVILEWSGSDLNPKWQPISGEPNRECCHRVRCRVPIASVNGPELHHRACRAPTVSTGGGGLPAIHRRRGAAGGGVTVRPEGFELLGAPNDGETGRCPSNPLNNLIQVDLLGTR